MRWALRRWDDWSLFAKGFLLLALPLLFLAVALISGYELGQQVANAEAEARRTLQVQSDLQQLHKLLAEATTGVHGYLLTGRDDFLSPYWMAEAEIDPTLAKLNGTMRDPLLRERLESSEVQFRDALARLETLRTSGRFADAEELRAQLLASQAVLDPLREQLIAMQVREGELVEQRAAAVAAALRLSLVMTVLSIGGALLVATLAARLFYTGIVRRVRRIAANADRLVRDQPLEPLPSASDELGRLTQQLEAASGLLAKRVTESQSANRAKNDFLSRVSHELRTPMNAVLGFAQLLESQAPADSVERRNAEQIVSAGRHLLGLIDELLDISRIEAGQLKLAIEPVALAPLLAEVCALASALARERSVRIEPPECDEALRVVADRRRLTQVLLNLVTNAVKHNRPHGWVRVRASHAANGANADANAGGQVRIEVVDNGWGLDANARGRLFQPFERLGAEARGVEGAGLGLAIASRLVEAMNGSLDVESVVNEGSTFAVCLPAEALAPQPALRGSRADPAHAAPPLAERTRRALSIEDNASNQALLDALFARRPDWELSSAATVAAGVEAALRAPPDLILLDLHLPDGSGEDVIARLRQDPRFGQTPIVVLTADVVPETRQRLEAQGAFDFLTKPIDIARFMAVLDRVPR